MWTLLLLSAIASPPSSEPADPPLTATWVLDEREDALRTKHQEAVEAAVEQLPWAVRGLARGPLEKVVRSCARLDLALKPEAFRVRCDDDPEFELERDQAKSTIEGEDGAPVEVRFSTSPRAATLLFQGAKGGQQTRYVLKGEALAVTTEIRAEQLSDPISWTVRYRRAP